MIEDWIFFILGWCFYTNIQIPRLWCQKKTNIHSVALNTDPWKSWIIVDLLLYKETFL